MHQFLLLFLCSFSLRYIDPPEVPDNTPGWNNAPSRSRPGDDDQFFTIWALAEFPEPNQPEEPFANDLVFPPFPESWSHLSEERRNAIHMVHIGNDGGSTARYGKRSPETNLDWLATLPNLWYLVIWNDPIFVDTLDLSPLIGHPRLAHIEIYGATKIQASFGYLQPKINGSIFPLIPNLDFLALKTTDHTDSQTFDISVFGQMPRFHFIRCAFYCNLTGHIDGLVGMGVEVNHIGKPGTPFDYRSTELSDTTGKQDKHIQLLNLYDPFGTLAITGNLSVLPKLQPNSGFILYGSQLNGPISYLK